jgi:ribosome biogenesis ATPase
MLELHHNHFPVAKTPIYWSLMAPHRRGGRTLSQGLDREVHQVIRKIIDERTQYGDEFRPTFPIIYDEIRRSNSSLNRKPKKLLEDSIQRVLDVIQQDAAESDPEDYVEPELSPQPVQRASNGLNKSMVAMWSTANTSGASTPVQQPPGEANSKLDKSDRGDKPEPARKKRKRTTTAEINTDPPTHVSLADLGGVGPVIKQFADLLTIPLMCPSISRVQSVRGILIHGPPGCGKTTIANAIAATYGVNFIDVSAPSIVSGMSGESEKALRDCFEQAKQAAPCLLFLDEIDAITPKRESASREMEKRIVAQLATLMDDLDPNKNEGKPVIVLAATNRPDALDPALRRGGRFDKEINMNVPNEKMREEILRALTQNIILSEDVDLAAIAIRTPGYVGADLKDLVSTASNTAIQRFQDALAAEASAAASSDPVTDPDAQPTPHVLQGSTSSQMDIDTTSPATNTQANPKPQLAPELIALQNMLHYLTTHPPSATTTITTTQTDFLTSLPKINPSALREGFATVPNTTFASIGGLTGTITSLTESIIRPILSPTLYARLGIHPSSGTLLFGPPGCGKTLLAKATANASHANFISVKGPELLNKYVGESERAVRAVFTRARSSVPVIIFFDELDALVPRRDGASSEASARVVNTLLTELDGVGGDRDGIYVVAATNRPDLIDGAILRPGRLDNVIYIPLPDADGRVDILRRLCRGMPGVVFGSYLEGLARGLDGFSGADLANLKTRAGYVAIRRMARDGSLDHGSGEGAAVTEDDFREAATEVRRSVNEAEMKRYERLRKQWEGGRPDT